MGVFGKFRPKEKSDWKTRFGEKMSASKMSSKHIRATIDLILRNISNTDSPTVIRLKAELEFRSKKGISERKQSLINTLVNSKELDKAFYKSNMNFMIDDPDLMDILFNNHLIPVDILVLYQSKILWSSFFFVSKSKITEEYVLDLVQSIHMSDDKWGMVADMLDLSDFFIQGISDYVPLKYLMNKKMSFQFWKNNMHRLYTFRRKSLHEEEGLLDAWRFFLREYSKYITASLIYDSKDYIPKKAWTLISDKVEMSSSYVVKLNRLLNVTMYINKFGASDKVFRDCKDVINWDSIDYQKMDDRLIVELKNYVTWRVVFDSWGSEIMRQRTSEEQKEYERTGDVLRYKNCVDWPKQLIKWDIKGSKHFGFDSMMTMNRSFGGVDKLPAEIEGADDIIEGLI